MNHPLTCGSCHTPLPTDWEMNDCLRCDKLKADTMAENLEE